MTDDDPPRRRPVQREHELARGIRQFARDGLDISPLDVQFFAFDSAQKATDNQRVRQAARGVVTGTPDTLLCVLGHKPFWAELKYGKGIPSDDQERLLTKLIYLGHHAWIIRSVEEYRVALDRLHFPLRSNASLIAADLDLKVAARIAKAEQRVASPAGRAPKAGPRFTAAKRTTKRWAKAGLRV